jgi:hypothetical protein
MSAAKGMGQCCNIQSSSLISVTVPIVASSNEFEFDSISIQPFAAQQA